MSGFEVKRAELVWPGKYDASGQLIVGERLALPFQVVETINESRATREAEKRPTQRTLFDIWKGEEGETFDQGWRNKLIWGDNLLVMGSLLESFAGKVDLIYIDPPFATGADFSFNAVIGDSTIEAHKDPSLIEEKAYYDTWGAGLQSYLSMMAGRISLMRDLLSETGSLFVHCDWHVGYMLRCLLDEQFGREHFLNEIVWYYYNKFQGNVNRFAADHDVIFWYRKGANYRFTPLKENRPEGKVRQIRRAWDKEKGRIVNVKGADGKVLYQETDVRTVDDVWRISMLQPADRTENVGFPTQKPEALLRRIVEATTQPGELVADFFCGSGTTLAVAEKMGRRWIGCDLSRWAAHLTRKRLLGIDGCKPFDVLNLGKYERQHWQTLRFGSNHKAGSDQALYEYLAFVLRLYGAQPIAGFTHLHGKKAQAMVHIGAIDAPVTIDEIDLAISECVRVEQAELHILGWEWEMGLAGPNNDYRKGGLMHEVAKERGVKLLLLQIPREVMEEQAVSNGEVAFFELAYLDVAITKPKKLTAVVRLKDFVIPNTELIPEEVREKVKKWSDYIDYWGVDWDFQNDTFTQGWVAYRTRKERTLALSSDPHRYGRAGTYRVVVKVVDIFGNDTSQSYGLQFT